MTDIREEIFNLTKKRHKYPLPEDTIDEILKIFQKLIDEKIAEQKTHGFHLQSKLDTLEEIKQELKK